MSYISHRPATRVLLISPELHYPSSGKHEIFWVASPTLWPHELFWVLLSYITHLLVNMRFSELHLPPSGHTSCTEFSWFTLPVFWPNEIFWVTSPTLWPHEFFWFLLSYIPYFLAAWDFLSYTPHRLAKRVVPCELHFPAPVNVP